MYAILMTVHTQGNFIVLPHSETRPHYPDTEPLNPCPILIIPSAWLGSDKYQFLSMSICMQCMLCNVCNVCNVLNVCMQNQYWA